MKNVVVFANTIVGYNVLKLLKDDLLVNIKSIYLYDQYPDINKKIIALFKEDSIIRKFESEKSFIDNLDRHSKIDFLISIYWPHLFSEIILKHAINTINFHPAYLPTNRGWYPHVHSIIDGSILGVTLHQITKGADEGKIWVQKKIEIPQFFTSMEAYSLLQNEIFEIFKTNFKKIINGEIMPFEQNHNASNYHKKNELDKLDFIDIDNLQYKNLINILRARSFGNKGFSYFTDNNGNKIFLNLRLSQTNNFN